MKINYLELLNEKKYFNWTPKFVCQDSTETSQLIANYQQQTGQGVKIKINELLSIVIFTFVLRGYITQVSDGDNYARIGGLPYIASSYGAVSFGQFSYGVDSSRTSAPNGQVNGNSIQVLTQRSGMDRWVAYPNNLAIISGGGYYFTQQ